MSAGLSLKTRRIRLFAVCAPGLLVVLAAAGAYLVSRAVSDIGFGKWKLLACTTVGLGLAGAGAILHRKAASDDLAGRRGYWKTVLFLVFAIVVLPVLTVFAADKAVGLAMWARPPAPLLVFPPHYRVSYRTPEFAFTAETNSIGIRDREINWHNKDGFRVLALGDSYTYGWGVENANAWPKVVERLLTEKGRDAQVFNLGCPGTSVDAYAAIAERAIPVLRPDVVVVAVLQGDDLKQLDLGPTTDRLFKFNGVDGRATDTAFARVLPNFDELRSRLPRAISADDIRANWQGLATSMSARFSVKERERFDSTDAKVRELLLDGGLNPWDVYFAVKQPDYLAFTLHPDGQDAVRAIDAMGSCLERIRESARAVNAKVQTVAVPAACYASAKGLESRRKVGYMLPDSALQSDAPDEAIRRACGLAGVAFHTCTASFRSASAGRELYFEYDGHFNADGHALFAERVAGLLTGSAD